MAESGTDERSGDARDTGALGLLRVRISMPGATVRMALGTVVYLAATTRNRAPMVVVGVVGRLANRMKQHARIRARL